MFAPRQERFGRTEMCESPIRAPTRGRRHFSFKKKKEKKTVFLRRSITPTEWQVCAPPAF